MNTTSQIAVQKLSNQFGKIIINTNGIGLSQLDKDPIVELFKQHGLLLFRGFESNFEKFVEFSNSLSKDFIDYTGGVFKRKKIGNNPTVLSVNDFKDGVKLHGEMYYQKEHPSMLWFFCARPPIKDGQTIVCDGKEFYNELSNNLKTLLGQKCLKFSAKLDKDVWQARFKTDNIDELKNICSNNNIQVKINDDLSINQVYICPAIYPSQCGTYQIFINSLLPAKEINPNVVSFDDNSEITKDIMSELNEIADRITVEINWQKGDILMLDNNRIMHGRRAFSDNERDIYIRLCSPAFSLI